MKVWSYINKKTNDLIRFNITFSSDPEFGTTYFFTDLEYCPIWVIYNEDDAKLAMKEFVHPQYSISYKRPSTDEINISDYELIKFEN